MRTHSFYAILVTVAIITSLVLVSCQKEEVLQCADEEFFYVPDDTLACKNCGAESKAVLPAATISTTPDVDRESYIYPNPFWHECTIHYELGDSPFGSARIEIYDNKGDMVQNFFLNNSSGDVKFGSWSDVGVYRVYIIRDGRILEKMKAVKIFAAQH